METISNVMDVNGTYEIHGSQNEKNGKNGKNSVVIKIPQQQSSTFVTLWTSFLGIGFGFMTGLVCGGILNAFSQFTQAENIQMILSNTSTNVVDKIRLIEAVKSTYHTP